MVAHGWRLVYGARMDTNDESEFRAGEQAHSLAAHRDLTLKSLGDNAKFAGLLDIALPNKSVRQVAKVFEGKASRTAIGHWRSGYRAPPKWILDKLCDMAFERVRQLATIKPGKIKGAIGARVLMAYMARRARERDAKK